MSVAPFAPRACPICGASQSRKLFRQSFEQLSVARLLDGYDVVACIACGFTFADNVPDQAAFDTYYRELSKYDYNDRAPDERPKLDRRFLDTADAFEAAIPSRDATVLEFGSASGELLYVLTQRGFTNTIGIDPSPGCCAAAANLFGVQSYVGTIFDIPPLPRSPDFVVLVGVMEHIRDVGEAVDRIAGILAARGRVYLEVPDAGRFTARADAPFQEFSVEHINFFSAQSLTNLMATHGFRAVRTGRTVGALHDIAVPVAFGIYERTTQPEEIVKDVESEPNLRAYIAEGLDEDRLIRARIASAMRRGERIIVWGVGTHTQRLLANGGLDPSRIAVFVDSNPKYQQQQLHGIPVVPPHALRERPEAILISSRGFQKEIYEQIRHSLGISNRVITLYD